MSDHALLILTLVLSFVLCAIFTPLLIPMLRRLKAGQSIREEGPQSHLSKAGTPTMGGLAMLLAMLAACLICGPRDHDLFVLLAVLLAFGLLGFLDDFIKVVLKRNLGLRAWQKFLLQVLLAVLLALYQQHASQFGSAVFVPFLNRWWDLGVFYLPFVVFVVVAMSNAVNLTDGLDGLAAGVTAPVALFFAVVSLGFCASAATGNFCAALAGACLGFLLYNRHPASLFMGDTGSLALGGALAAAAVLSGTEFFLLAAGAVYVLEALSVVLQVGYFKATHGKRIFRMAPLHHHFELGGWSEVRVVLTAILFTVCMIVLSMGSFYL